MYKLIDANSFFNEDEPSITILHPENIKSLVKTAGDQQIEAYIKDIQPEKGKMYLHILALGAGEYFGSNKNGDNFPEGNLIEYYKSFETSPAHVFRHHINKSKDKAIGQVLFSVYNPRMHRVELIAEVDQSLGDDIERKIALGEYPSTSMACKTPYDVCSICGNKAHSRAEYCKHLRTQLGQMLPDGRRIAALNVGPLKFFDISIVIKPADVTSSILRKVAFAEPVSSIELAEAEELSDEQVKEASFKKFSEFIKKIETGQIIKTSPHLSQILARVQDPDYHLIENLTNVPLEHAFRSMAELGISPSLSFLAELISRRVLGDVGKNMGVLIEELVNTVGVNNMDIPHVEFESEGEVSPFTHKALLPYVERSSLFPEYVEKRASHSGVGYANLGSGWIEPTDEELRQAHMQPMNEATHTPLFQTLIGIGGVALLAKWYIANLIQQRVNRPQHQNNAKIVLTKRASDVETMHKLCKASMEQVVVIVPPDTSVTDSSKSIGLSLFRKFLSKSPNPQVKNLSRIVKTVDLVGSLNKKEMKHEYE